MARILSGRPNQSLCQVIHFVRVRRFGEAQLYEMSFDAPAGRVTDVTGLLPVGRPLGSYRVAARIEPPSEGNSIVSPLRAGHRLARFAACARASV